MTLLPRSVCVCVCVCVVVGYCQKPQCIVCTVSMLSCEA